MAQTVADHMLERLRQWDVEYVFGYPGDGINAIMGAFGRAGDKPRFIQSRHEEMSAFEAVGYAKFTDKVGVCLATSGPGAIHLLNGLYDAKADHVPVVAIVGQTERSAVGGSYQQEVDLLSLFKDVASDFRPGRERPGAVPQPHRPRDPDRDHPPGSDRDHRAERPAGARVLSTGPRVQGGAFQSRDDVADSSARPRCCRAGGGDPQRRGEGGDPDRPGSARRGSSGARGRRPARCGHRQGAARQGRAARRPRVRHRSDRAARHPAQL